MMNTNIILCQIHNLMCVCGLKTSAHEEDRVSKRLTDFMTFVMIALPMTHMLLVPENC